MDNENKINEKDIVPDSKSIFLRDDAIQYVKRESYQIEKEFAKTKKNKSPFVWLTILIFVAVFTAAAVLVTVFIQNRSKNVSVDVESFADVNLKEVLDKAKRLETMLQKARRELQDLILAEENEIRDVRQKASREIELIRTRRLGQAQENRQVAAIRQQEEADIAAIEADYKPRIEAKEVEIADLQRQLAEYDTQMVEQAKQQQEILDNERRKFELEMQESVAYYEKKIEEIETSREKEVSELRNYQDTYVTQLNTNHNAEVTALKRSHAEEIRRLILKYNPLFTNEELKSIVVQAVSDMPEVKLQAYRNVLAQEGILSVQEFNLLREHIRQSNLLLERLQQVPYTNSVPDALDHIQASGANAYNTYEALWSAAARNLEWKNMLLTYYDYALNSLVTNSREDGYILDPRDPANIQVYIDQLYDISDGDVAYVFRTDEELIGTIKFSVRGGYVTAALVERSSQDKQIMPFDKILIQR